MKKALNPVCNKPAFKFPRLKGYRTVAVNIGKSGCSKYLIIRDIVPGEILISFSYPAIKAIFSVDIGILNQSPEPHLVTNVFIFDFSRFCKKQSSVFSFRFEDRYNIFPGENL